MSEEGRDDDEEGLDDGFFPTGDGDEEPSVADEPAPPADGTDPTREADAGAPLGDLADRARHSRDADATDDVMDAFSEVDVDDSVDVEDLWAELGSEDLEETVAEPRGSAERDVRVIDKREYCMRCQYFSAPPEVRCEADGAEIVEMVDTEQFEVVDCPILRGEEELENLRR